MSNLGENQISRRAFLRAQPGAVLGLATLGSSALSSLANRALAAAPEMAAATGTARNSAKPKVGVFAWGPGPQSGLPWWSGGWSALEHLEKLRTDSATGKVSGLDQVLVYARNGGWNITKLLNIGETNSNHIWLSQRGCPSLNIAYRVWPSSLKETADKTAWRSHIVSQWPASFGTKSEHWDMWMSPRVPVGWKDGMDAATGRALAVEVWRKAADGYFNRMWENLARTMKGTYLDKHKLGHVKLIFRPFWECNNTCEVGQPHAINSSSYACCETDDEVAAARRGQEECVRMIKQVFPEALAHWCPLKKGKTKRNIELYCPDNADIIGPDYYDNWPASRTQAEWDINVMTTGVEGGPVGLQRWLDFCKKQGKPLGIGEWGIGDETEEATNLHGGDNPIFIRNMIGFFWKNRDWMAYEAYFNSQSHRLEASNKPANPKASAAYRAAWATLRDSRGA